MSGNNRGKKQGGRGRGRGRGGGGRGQSRGGGGRGRNRELIPSSVGFLYRPRSNVDEYDDFKVYGQFSSDDDEEEQTIKYPHGAKSKKKNQKNKKKNNLGFIRESTPSLGASYDDDVEERPGLGLTSSSSSGSGGHRQKEQRFANGKSKYFKTVAFTRSSSTLNLDQASTTVSETETSQVVTTETAESSSTNVVTQQLSELKIEETQVLNVDQVTQVEAAIVTKPEELEPVNVKGKEPQEVVLDSDRNDEKEEQEDDDDEDEDNIQFNGQDDYQEEEDDDDDDDDSDDEDITEFYPDEDDEDDDDDDDELLLEDMMVMSDYIENIEGNVEDLNELLVWSQMQDGLELLESEFSYSDLDAPPPQVNKSKNKKKKKNADDRWKNDFDDEEEFILRDSADAFVDPEIFEQTMRSALSEVPPSLKPGMRRWFEKQQKKELRKKKKEEEKARRKKEQEKAAKGKGKGKNKYSDSDLTTQMTKIDDRMRDFINDNTITSFQFAPMSKYIRKEVHLLAKVYNLKSESVGSSANRATIITKTETSRIPRDRKTLDRYLINVQNNLDDQFRIQQKRNNYSFSINSKRGGGGGGGSSSNNNNNNYKKGGNRSKSTSSTANNNNSSSSGSSTAPRHGTIVGQGVAPINESNVGHRMLAAMGWRQGDALGAKNEGIIAPIEAVIRKKGLGLGS